MVFLKILDASSFIHGYNPSIEEGIHYATRGIIDEVITKSEVVELSIEYGKLKIREPEPETVKKVRKMAINITGDTLSKNDIEILALAIDLNGVLYTDDYGLQNVSERFNIKTENIIFEGIKGRVVWKLICKGCKKIYDLNYNDNICDVCGSPLNRKIISRIKSNKQKTNKKRNNRRGNHKKNKTDNKNNNTNNSNNLNNNEIKFI
ncbi:PIN domain-containing protein [Methanococcus aeolicus]|uniref:ribonuclease VapC n=1 Tax=Methanococcus aeolicus TaxID=42879 RepID=UPI0021C69AA0|nr:ribonuclease VapC [Methanococcus aeolicus]UXM85530.1 ribonuclease VapC [Methanococcus aeolicus]